MNITRWQVAGFLVFCILIALVVGAVFAFFQLQGLHLLHLTLGPTIMSRRP